MRAVILGLDLSLTSPAAVCIPDRWKVGSWRQLSWYSCAPVVPEDLKARYDRIEHIVARMLAFARQEGVTHAYVEDYAYSRSSSSTTKLAELGGHARVEFARSGLVLHPVTASQARRQLLGRLPAKDAKRLTHEALTAAGAPFRNGDEADAFVIANFGLTELGLLAMCLA